MLRPKIHIWSEFGLNKFSGIDAVARIGNELFKNMYWARFWGIGCNHNCRGPHGLFLHKFYEHTGLFKNSGEKVNS